MNDVIRVGGLNCGPHYINCSEKENWMEPSAFLPAWTRTSPNKANALRIEKFFWQRPIFCQKTTGKNDRLRHTALKISQEMKVERLPLSGFLTT